MNTVFNISELNRRLANLIRLGSIVKADYTNARLKIKSGSLLSGWLPWISVRAGNDRSWWAPETGEQVLIFSPSGDLAQGVVLPGIYQNAYPAPAKNPDHNQITYSDGAIFNYDRHRHHWNIHLPAGATITLVAAGGVSIIGDVEVTGDIKATGEVEDRTRTMSADREIYNRHTHRGDSGGFTGQPRSAQ